MIRILYGKENEKKLHDRNFMMRGQYWRNDIIDKL